MTAACISGAGPAAYSPVSLNSHSPVQRGQSALQVWGIPSTQRDQDVEVEDEDKEAFGAHVESFFADTK